MDEEVKINLENPYEDWENKSIAERCEIIRTLKKMDPPTEEEKRHYMREYKRRYRQDLKNNKDVENKLNRYPNEGVLQRKEVFGPVGARLKSLVKEKGTNASILSRVIGIPNSNFYTYFNGTVIPNKKVRMAIEKELDLELGTIYSWYEEAAKAVGYSWIDRRRRHYRALEYQENKKKRLE